MINPLGRSQNHKGQGHKQNLELHKCYHFSRLADEYEEKDVRKRKWFSLEEAQKMLCAFKPIQAKYLVALKQSKSQSPPSDHESSQNNLRS